MSSTPIVSDRPAAVRRPAGHSPLRRPHSIRRTASVEVSWPDGRHQPSEMLGLARDIYTDAADQPPLVLAEDCLHGRLDGRTILDIASTPPREGIGRLAGERGGGYLRTALDEVLPAERSGGTPLYLLIDDLSGTSLVAGWAWKGWELGQHPPEDAASRAVWTEKMAGVCSGFTRGNSVFDGFQQSYMRVGPLQHPDDPAGWHALRALNCASLRRARRIDVWFDGEVVRIDAAFQDSSPSPDGGRIAIHEYLLSASADPVSMRLLAVDADPRILPYPECPAAIGNIGALVGTPMRELRLTVLQQLRRTRGCTHLNDALRALAEVPVLVEQLRRQ